MPDKAEGALNTAAAGLRREMESNHQNAFHRDSIRIWQFLFGEKAPKAAIFLFGTGMV
jgi:hypothetical protein